MDRLETRSIPIFLTMIVNEPSEVNLGKELHTVCPRRSDQFCFVSYYLKWVTTPWTHSNTALPSKYALYTGYDLRIRIDLI